MDREITLRVNGTVYQVMEVRFVGEPDPMTPIGTKGIGEIG